MNKIETACAWALAVANDDAHGYDQGNRWGPDYDCSALVISAWENAGVPVKSRGATYTGNMRGVFLGCGFADVTGSVDLASGAGLRRGDVLLNIQSHTALYMGNGQLVQASGNELGGVTGGRTGDQTGREIHVSGYYNFPWDCVLRYTAEDAAGEPIPVFPDSVKPQTAASGGTYIVRQGDSLWSIAEKTMGYGFLYTKLKEANALTSDTVLVGQELIIPGMDSRTIQLTLKTEVADVLERRARERGVTVAQLIEDAFKA